MVPISTSTPIHADSAIWHNMPQLIKYLATVNECLPPKRSWKDLLIGSKKSLLLPCNMSYDLPELNTRLVRICSFFDYVPSYIRLCSHKAVAGVCINNCIWQYCDDSAYNLVLSTCAVKIKLSKKLMLWNVTKNDAKLTCGLDVISCKTVSTSAE